MKPAPFAYARPATLEEAIARLSEYGDRARVLAGGQTLIATLNMRLSTPELLLDITAIPGLAGIEIGPERIRIGALTSHREIEQSPELAQVLPLLTQAAPHIAHVAIRNAGTLGGSLALGDPAAEWPACCLALDAVYVLCGPQGERRCPARAFYRGLYENALGPAELITAVEFPRLGTGYRSCFLELARRHGDYAIVGLALVVRPIADRLEDVRLAFIGAGPTAMLARGAMAALQGEARPEERLAQARAALAKDLAPDADLYSSADTKMQLARVLLGRALNAIGEQP
jgi:carbon-monoxide dehydrogenase medium subunit